MHFHNHTSTFSEDLQRKSIGALTKYLLFQVLIIEEPLACSCRLYMFPSLNSVHIAHDHPLTQILSLNIVQIKLPFSVRVQQCLIIALVQIGIVHAA